jgi:hypothetical protein
LESLAFPGISGQPLSGNAGLSKNTFQKSDPEITPLLPKEKGRREKRQPIGKSYQNLLNLQLTMPRALACSAGTTAGDAPRCLR